MVLGDHDIRGLYVAMYDTGPMGRGEALRGLPGDFDGYVERQGAPGHLAVQGLALQEGHSEERAAVLLANLVHRADVGVVQRSSGLRLAPESRGVVADAGQFPRQELQRDGALEPGVLRFVDDPHAPFAQRLQNAVVGNVLLGHAGAQPMPNWREGLYPSYDALRQGLRGMPYALGWTLGPARPGAPWRKTKPDQPKPMPGPSSVPCPTRLDAGTASSSSS